MGEFYDIGIAPAFKIVIGIFLLLGTMFCMCTFSFKLRKVLMLERELIRERRK